MKKLILVMILFITLGWIVPEVKASPPSGAACSYCGWFFVFGDPRPFDDCFDRMQACFKKSKRMPGQSVDACMCANMKELLAKYNKWDLLQRNMAWVYGAAGGAGAVGPPLGRGAGRGARRRGPTGAGLRGPRPHHPAPAAPLDRARYRGGVVHLRDRLDPDALPGALQRHPFVRADALGLHPGAGARGLLGAAPRGPVRQSAPGAGDHPGLHGLFCPGDAAALFPGLRLDGHLHPDLRALRAGVRGLQHGPLRDLPAGDAPRHLLRRHHPAAHQPHHPAGFNRHHCGSAAGLRPDHDPDAGRSGLLHNSAGLLPLPAGLPVSLLRLRFDAVHRAAGDRRRSDLRPMAAAQEVRLL